MLLEGGVNGHRGEIWVDRGKALKDEIRRSFVDLTFAALTLLGTDWTCFTDWFSSSCCQFIVGDTSTSLCALRRASCASDGV